MTKRAQADVTTDRLVLAGAGLRVDVSLAEGTFSVPRVLSNACAHGELEDGRSMSTAGRPWAVVERPRRFEDAHGRGLRSLLRSADGALALALEICVYDERPFALLRLGVENTGRTPRRLASLSPVAMADGGAVAFAGPPDGWRWFRHGWQSWSPSLSLSTAQQDLDARPPVSAPAAPLAGRGRFASDEVAALLDPESGRTILLGFITAQRHWTQVRLNARERAIDAVAFADGALLRPGEMVWSERLLIDAAADAAPAFERYADALAREMGARVPATTPAGWCSWYYYFTTVTEDDVIKNLRVLQQHRDDLPVRYVQIDDGYQSGIGDWTATNEKFPHGMRWLAREIREAGFTPGLWLAPLLAGDRSRLFAEHPDWMIRTNDGVPAFAMRNWEQDCYGLDGTRPEAEAWLRDLFREVCEGWGYDYVKTDFLFGGALAGRRFDKTASRIEAYRRGLAAIREGVGDRFVLGCGALMGPSVGLIDAQRIGPDVAPWWRFRRSRMVRTRGRPLVSGEPSMEGALRNVFTRGWMHGRLWANDPDCLLARDERTKLTLPEVQSLATAIALSGGALFISDDLTRLSRGRLDLVSLLLPPLGEAGIARDLLREAMPSTLELKVRRPFGSWRLLAAFNWLRKRRPLTVPLPAGRWHAFDFWSQQYVGVRDGRLVLEHVPAHGVRLLSLRPALDRPQLLATTFHYSMGGREVLDARWNARGRALRVALRSVAKKDGAIFVSVPLGYRLTSARLDDEMIAAIEVGRGYAAIRLTLRAPATLTLSFASSASRTVSTR